MGNNPVNYLDPSGQDWYYDNLYGHLVDLNNERGTIQQMMQQGASREQLLSESIVYFDKYKSMDDAKALAANNWWVQLSERTQIMGWANEEPVRSPAGFNPGREYLQHELANEQQVSARLDQTISLLSIPQKVGKDLGQAAMDILKGVLESQGVPFKGFMDAVGTLPGDLTKILSALIHNGDKIFDTLDKGVRQGMKNFFGSSDGSTATSGFIGQLLSALGDLANLPLKEIADAIAQKGWGAAADIGGYVLKAMGLTMDGLYGLVSEVAGPTAASALFWVISEAGGAIESGQGLWEWLHGLMNKAGDQLSAAADLAKSLPGEIWKSVTAEWVPTLEAAAVKFVANLIADLIPGGGWAKTIFDAVTFVINEAPRAAALVGSVKNAVMAAVDGTGVGAVADFVVEGLHKGLMAALQGLLDLVHLGSLPKDIKEGLKRAADAVLNLLKRLLTALAGSLKAVAGRLGINFEEMVVPPKEVKENGHTVSVWVEGKEGQDLKVMAAASPGTEVGGNDAKDLKEKAEQLREIEKTMATSGAKGNQAEAAKLREEISKLQEKVGANIAKTLPAALGDGELTPENQEKLTEQLIDGPQRIVLRPGGKYTIGKAHYEADDEGKLVKTTFTIDNSMKPSKRESVIGDIRKLGNWDDIGFHLLGARFGGSTYYPNVIPANGVGITAALSSKLGVPAAPNINQSAYKQLEIQWAAAAKKGLKVSVAIEISYGSDKLRPDAFFIEVEIGSTKITFDLKNRAGANLEEPPLRELKDTVEKGH